MRGAHKVTSIGAIHGKFLYGICWQKLKKVVILGRPIVCRIYTKYEYIYLKHAQFEGSQFLVVVYNTLRPK